MQNLGWDQFKSLLFFYLYISVKFLGLSGRSFSRGLVPTTTQKSTVPILDLWGAGGALHGTKAPLRRRTTICSHLQLYHRQSDTYMLTPPICFMRQWVSPSFQTMSSTKKKAPTLILIHLAQSKCQQVEKWKPYKSSLVPSFQIWKYETCAPSNLF